MRSLGISAISIALTAAVVGNAYYQKKQFYPSVVYITKSNPSMSVSSSKGVLSCVVVVISIFMIILSPCLFRLFTFNRLYSF